MDLRMTGGLRSMEPSVSATVDGRPDRPAVPAAPPRAGSALTALVRVASTYGLVVLLLALIAFFGLHPETSDTFLTAANWRTLIGSQAVLLVTALAFTLPLIAGEYDLSSGGVVVACGVLFAGLVSGYDAPIVGSVRLSPIVALLVTVGVGALIGLVNGVLVGLEVPSLIATLGTTIVLGGLTTWYTGGQTISTGLPRAVRDLGSATWFGVPMPAVLALVVALVVWYVLTHTPYGRRLHAIGSNAAAAQLVGIRVRRVVLASFVLGGGLAACAGCLLTARQGSGVPANGLSFVLPALAGTFLGATVIRPGQYNVIGTIVGLLFVAVSVNGLNLMGVDVWIQPVFNGLALIVAVLLSGVLHRRMAART